MPLISQLGGNVMLKNSLYPFQRFTKSDSNVRYLPYLFSLPDEICKCAPGAKAPRSKTTFLFKLSRQKSEAGYG